ncbi:MAG: hypothetical protein R3A46_21180 [Thermomicrobiales bacterium]
MSAQRHQIHVVVDEETSEDELEAIRAFLNERDMSASVEASYPAGARESLSHGTSRHDPGVEGIYPTGKPDWTVLIHAPVNELASDLGSDALRSALDGLRSLRGDQTGTSPARGLLFLVDEETGVRFDVEFQLPLHAFSELANLRITSFRADPVSFHRKSGPSGRWSAPN